MLISYLLTKLQKSPLVKAINKKVKKKWISSTSLPLKFLANNFFFGELFCNFFTGFEISIKHRVFWIPIDKNTNLCYLFTSFSKL